MVPHDNSDNEYVTGDEGDIKDEKAFIPAARVKLVRSFPKLPKLQSPDGLSQFVAIVEAILREEGYSEEDFNSLRVKMEIVSNLSECREIYSMANLLITRPWVDLRQHLLHSFASVARMRSEANQRLAKLVFDRDQMANKIRSLYDWFSLHDSSMSTHEFVTRIFNRAIFPQRYLEKIIERAETRYPSVNWRNVPTWQLCDIVEEVCLLFAEIDSVSVKQDKPDSTRRVKPVEGSSSSGSRGGNWLESWMKDFRKVYYVSDEQVASTLGSRADDTRKLFSKKSQRPYFLIAFKDDHVAYTATEGFDSKVCREFQLRKPLN